MTPPHTLPDQVLLRNEAVLDRTIGKLLGQGLGYDDWKKELERLGRFWTESLKNIVIKREFSFFRDEILRLQSEPNTAHGMKLKTNSLESILKRLQGLEWVKGVPNEMEQRKRDGRLLGKDAKVRCLQYHVARWKAEGTSASQVSSASTTNSEYPEVVPNMKDAKAISTNLPHTAMSAAVATSATTVSITTPSSNNGLYPDGDSFIFQKPLQFANSNISSMFGNKTALPGSDPTLYGDFEIPWVPHTSSQEIELHRGDIAIDDFASLFERNNFPIEPPSEELSFELPRENGINDSYGTYISQIIQDSNAHRSIIEGIFDFYGSQPSKDIWLTSQTQDTDITGNSQLEPQQTCTGTTAFSEQNFRISPQDLPYNDYGHGSNTDQLSYNIDTEALAHAKTSLSGSSQIERHEADARLSRDQNEPVILATRTSKISSQPYSDIDRPSGRALDSQNDSLYDILAELRTARDELAAAENTVSKLVTKVKWLEASAKRERQHIEGMSIEDHTEQKNIHKRSNNETHHGAKRLKGINVDLDISNRPNATAGGRAHCSFNQNNDETASNYVAISGFSTSETPKPCRADAVANLDPSPSRIFNDSHPPAAPHAAEKGGVIQASSIQTQWSELANDRRNHRPNNSGYASLDIGVFNCRASSPEDLEESMAWVS